MNKIITKLIFLTLLFLLATEGVSAAQISVRPFLIDETVTPRDIVTKDVVLTNETTHKLNIYATVNEISLGSNGEIKEFISPIMSDRTNTITSWIEITRGRIEIESGETKTVPLTFRIHPEPTPGNYYAFVGFASASKRYQAEAQTKSGDAEGIIVKLSIEDESEEFLRISGFLIDRFITKEDQRVIDIELENLGDVSAIPTGEIIFYDSVGQEITAINVNDENISVPAGEKVTIQSRVPFGDELGRFKANVSLQYGSKQRAALYDTTQFFMMPLHIMLIMLVAVVLVTLLVFFLLHRSLTRYDEETEGVDLAFYVKEGHEPNPKDHDIDLSSK